jgi:hypothetical protein
MCLALEKKILTWNNLQNRGKKGPNWCTLCKSNEKHISQLLMFCTFTSQAWKEVESNTGIRGPVWGGNTLEEELNKWCNNLVVKNIRTLPLITTWRIWLNRNANIFEGNANMVLCHDNASC